VIDEEERRDETRDETNERKKVRRRDEQPRKWRRQNGD
jgi:hypothetical protein